MTTIYIWCHDGKLTEFYLHDLVNTIQTPASPCPWSEGWEATKYPCLAAQHINSYILFQNSHCHSQGHRQLQQVAHSV